MHHERCVFRLDPDPNDPEFFEAVARALQDLQGIGLRFDVVEEEEVDGNLAISWEAQDELGHLTLSKDFHTDICSFSLNLAKAHDLRRTVELLHERLDLITHAELVKSARRQRVMSPTVLLKLAMVTKRLDPETLAIISDSLTHRFPQVRFYAAYAVGLGLWPEFITDLELLLKGEPDEDVQEMAERALAGCRHQQRKNGR